jgi:hypothetical protein
MVVLVLVPELLLVQVLLLQLVQVLAQVPVLLVLLGTGHCCQLSPQMHSRKRWTGDAPSLPIQATCCSTCTTTSVVVGMTTCGRRCRHLPRRNHTARIIDWV